MVRYEIDGRTVSRAESLKARGIKTPYSEEAKRRIARTDKPKPVTAFGRAQVSIIGETPPARVKELEKIRLENLKRGFARAVLRKDVFKNRFGKWEARTKTGKDIAVKIEAYNKNLPKAEQLTQKQIDTARVKELRVVVRDFETFKVYDPRAKQEFKRELKDLELRRIVGKEASKKYKETTELLSFVRDKKASKDYTQKVLSLINVKGLDPQKVSKVKELFRQAQKGYEQLNLDISKKLGFKEYKSYEKHRGITIIDPLIQRSDKLKDLEYKSTKFTYGLKKAVYEDVQKTPLKLPLILLAGAGIGGVGTAVASIGYKTATAVSIVGKALGGVYIGDKLLKFYKSKTPESKGAVVGKTFTETAAFLTGGVIGSSLAIKSGFTPLPSVEPKLRLEFFKSMKTGRIIKGSRGEDLLYAGLTYKYGLKGRGGAIVGYVKGKGVRFGSPKVDIPKSSVVIAKTPAQKQILLKSIPKSSKAQAELGVRLFKATQFTKAKFYREAIYNSKSLTKKNLDIIYQFARSNKAYLYGSASAEAQKPSSLRRQFGDIDLQLNVNRAELKAKQLVKKLGVNFKVSKQQPTLIEKRVGKKWVHAVDIHNIDGSGGSGVAPESIFGFYLDQKPIIRQGIRYSPLGREGIAKGSSLFTGRTDIKGEFKFYPEAHRGKDIADFFTTQQALLRRKGLGFERIKSRKALEELKKYYTPQELAGGKVKIELYKPGSPSKPLKLIYYSPKISPSISRVRSISLSKSLSPSPSKSISISPSPSKSISPSPSVSRSISLSVSRSPSPSPSKSPSPSPSPSPSRIPSPSPRPSKPPYIPFINLKTALKKPLYKKQLKAKKQKLRFTPTIVRPKKKDERLRLFTGAELR